MSKWPVHVPLMRRYRPRNEGTSLLPDTVSQVWHAHDKGQGVWTRGLGCV